MNLSNQHHLYSNTSKDLSLKDYYPFGMVMPERNFSSDNYRFGFNGKLKDDEVKGLGNSYDFGARIYDPRIGIFLSIDPKASQFASWNPYSMDFDNPILYVDLSGEEPYKLGVTGVSGFTSFLKKENINSVESFIMKYGDWHDHPKSAANHKEQRFLYSEKWGWVDMKHLMNAANDALNSSPEEALTYGEWVETTQSTFSELGMIKEQSVFSPEDLTSNLLGANFANYLQSEYVINDGNEFATNLQNYLLELGFVDDPRVNPNSGYEGLAEGPKETVNPAKQYDYIPYKSNPSISLNTPADRSALELRDTYKKKKAEKAERKNQAIQDGSFNKR